MSRDDPTYSRVSSKFWSGAADEDWTDDMVLLGMYLLTCQARTTEGLYRLPKGYMAEDLPGEWPSERLTASLSAMVANGFVDYDDKARVVFLPKAMKYQRPDNANQQTAAIRNLKNLPATRLWKPFVEAAKTHCEAFHKRLVEAFPKGLTQGLPQAIPQGDGDSLLSSTSTHQPLSACVREDDPHPVDNSADPDRGCSIEHEEHEPEPPGSANGDGAADSHAATSDNVGTCDGKPCMAHDFPSSAYAPLRRAMLVSLHPEQQKAVGTKGDLDALLKTYSGHICAACQEAFGEFERPQLDGMCEQAVVAAVANLHGSQDVAAVMKSRLLRYGLAELIGDRNLEELRRTKRGKRRKGEPVRIGATLPPTARAKEGAP